MKQMNAESAAKARQRGSRPSPMKAMRLTEASKELAGISFEQTRPLKAKERAQWVSAKRGRGRPKKPAAEKSARVLVSITPDLLAAADAYARRQGISRAELFARGLTAVLPGQ